MSKLSGISRKAVVIKERRLWWPSAAGLQCTCVTPHVHPPLGTLGSLSLIGLDNSLHVAAVAFSTLSLHVGLR